MGTLLFLLFILAVVAGLAIQVYLSLVESTQAKLVIVWRHSWLYLVALIFLTLSLSYTEVDAGSVGVVKRFGRPVREAYPGLHFITPFVESLTTVAVQTRIVKPNEDASSLDLQIVHTEVTLAYHVDPEYATFVLVSLNNDAEQRVINPAIYEAIKATTAKYDVQELIAQRPKVRDDIEEFVKNRIAPYHIVAETTSITDFRFSDQFEQAIEAKVTAQQHAEQASNDLQRIKIEADQKVATAEGEAKALAAQRMQITPELLQLRTIEMLHDKWDGKLPQVIAGSGSIPMLDMLKAAGK